MNEKILIFFLKAKDSFAVELRMSDVSIPIFKKISNFHKLKLEVVIRNPKLINSVSDPYHFDSDPDPRIRIRDDVSGS